MKFLQTIPAFLQRSQSTGKQLFSTISFGFILLLLLSSSGCTQFKEVQLSQIGGVKIIKITDKGIEMELGMKINNPNNYAFSIYRSSFDIKLAGVDMGTAVLSKKEKVAANSDEMHNFHITTTFNKLLEGGLGGIFALFGKKNTEVEINGNLKVGKFLIRKSIPIARKQKVGLDNQTGTDSLFDMLK
jgi:LEA14-like dessication related protein